MQVHVKFWDRNAGRMKIGVRFLDAVSENNIDSGMMRASLNKPSKSTAQLVHFHLCTRVKRDEIFRAVALHGLKK
jgi:hypothetical protein